MPAHGRKRTSETCLRVWSPHKSRNDLDLVRTEFRKSLIHLVPEVTYLIRDAMSGTDVFLPVYRRGNENILATILGFLCIISGHPAAKSDFPPLWE